MGKISLRNFESFPRKWQKRQFILPFGAHPHVPAYVENQEFKYLWLLVIYFSFTSIVLILLHVQLVIT